MLNFPILLNTPLVWFSPCIYLHTTLVAISEISLYILSFLFLAGTGLAAVFINIAVENFAGWKFSATFDIIQKSYIAGFFVYVLFNLALVYSSVYIVTQFAPAAAGSGIPEIKGYLNGEINSPEVLKFELDVDPVRFSCTLIVLILIIVQELILTVSFFSEL